MNGDSVHIDPMQVGSVKKPPTTAEDMRAINEAKRMIEESRRMALLTLFQGKKIVPRKSKFADDAKQAKKAAQKVQSNVDKLGLSTPDLNVDTPNFNILVGLNFKRLTLPRLDMPGVTVRIPDITLGQLPGFNIGIIKILRIKLSKWRNRYIDFLPDVQLSALIGALLDKIPNLEHRFSRTVSV